MADAVASMANRSDNWLARRYGASVPSYSHPRLDDVPLAIALHALADPVRLAIVAELARSGPLNVAAITPPGKFPKSTMSFHLGALRAGGLVETVRSGRWMVNSLRRAAFDHRFPGLLAAILENCGAASVIIG